MEIEIVTIDGYEEVDRQMTTVRAGDDAVVFDMGLNLSQVLIHDNVETEKMHSLDLIDMGATPDDRVMSDLGEDVQIIVPTHGHFDHIGAISKLAHRYDVPVMTTPFAIELAKQRIEGENKLNVNNDLVRMEAGEMMFIDDPGNMELEFVHVTHSTVDAVNPVVHTLGGAVVYGLDKRMDHSSVLEDPIDTKHFREIGCEGNGVPAYIGDCTNAGRKGYTPSKSVAHRYFKDVMTSAEDYDGGIAATTFSSRISRVSPLVESIKDIGRQPVLLGCLMEKCSGAAGRLGSADLPGDLGMYGHCEFADRISKRIMKEGKENYPPTATGHQDEPRAMPIRMGHGETPCEIDDSDKAILSVRVIPEPTNESQRYQSERPLRMQGARIYDEIHVSGHLREEGHYEMLQALQPQHVIPVHQNLRGLVPYVDPAENQGYASGRDLHVAQDGDMIQLVK